MGFVVTEHRAMGSHRYSIQAQSDRHYSEFENVFSNVVLLCQVKQKCVRVFTCFFRNMVLLCLVKQKLVIISVFF